MFSLNRNFWRDHHPPPSDPEEPQDEHSHCRKCYGLTCRSSTNLPRKGCVFAVCPLLCGATFHSCKAEEHKKLCSNEIVPCINSAYGCPQTMRRSKRGSHLATCPASVVYCTMEWNRWPIFSKERQDRVPFVPKNHAKSGQLDAALAMRDQRILYEAMKAPRRVCRSLRNRLTERFPAVPLMSHSSSFAENSGAARTNEGPTNDVSNLKNEDFEHLKQVDVIESDTSFSSGCSRFLGLMELERDILDDNDTKVLFGDGLWEDEYQIPMQFTICDSGNVAASVSDPPGLDDTLAQGCFPTKSEVICDTESSLVVCDAEKPMDCSSTDSKEQKQAELSPGCFSTGVVDGMVVDKCADSSADVLSEKTNFCPVAGDTLARDHLEPFRTESSVKNIESLAAVCSDAPAESLLDKFSANVESNSGIEVCNGQLSVSNMEDMNSSNNLEFSPAFGKNTTSSGNNFESYRQNPADASSSEVGVVVSRVAPNLNEDSLCFVSHGDEERDGLDNALEHLPEVEYHQDSQMLSLDFMPPPLDPPPLSSQEVLSLDLNLESITRYQAKPRSMYTFLCAQNLRRDEYEWHFKNIHSEIHGGLSGWIESRCPLACYGCTHSIRRLNPVGGTLVYNTDVDSFGVRPDSWHCTEQERKNPCKIQKESVDCVLDADLSSHVLSESTDTVSCASKDSSSISDFDSRAGKTVSDDSNEIGREEISPKSPKNILNILPFEVLQHIARCLDSFSLCNLAITCFYLREVCKSIVEDRGIVVQEWQKKQFERGRGWEVTYQRWFFSTASTPIERWHFADSPSLSEHLKICPFNITAEPQKQPFRLCFVADQILRNPEAAKSLQKMYPEFDADSEDAKIIPIQSDEIFINGIGQNGFSEYNRVLKAFQYAHVEQPDDNLEQEH